MLHTNGDNPTTTEFGAGWAPKSVWMLRKVYCVCYSMYKVYKQLLIYKKINEVKLQLSSQTP
jgi:hypothetical protein